MQPEQNPPQDVTRLTFQDDMSWLKATAPINMSSMVVTLEVSKLVNGWLKATALRNMRYMMVTWEVSKLVNGWLKAFAFWNM